MGRVWLVLECQLTDIAVMDCERVNTWHIEKSVFIFSTEREKEIKALKQSSEDARAHNLQLATTLLQLRQQEQQLDKDQESLQKENDQLKSEADALWMLPALFGVTPLEMVNITLRQDQQQQE